MQHARSVDLLKRDPPSRECRVSVRDREGIEHIMTVNAPSRYHAFGLALKTLKRFHGDSVEKMTIQVMQNGRPLYRRIYVTTEQFEKWLAIDQPNDKFKEYILMLLGRIEPSRDFIRGIKARIKCKKLGTLHRLPYCATPRFPISGDKKVSWMCSDDDVDCIEVRPR